MTALIRAEQVSYSYPQRGMVLDQADLVCLLGRESR